MGHKIRQVDELKVDLFSIRLAVVIISSSSTVRTFDQVVHYVNFVLQAGPAVAGLRMVKVMA